MNVKYQIFVSSTYEDLKDERAEVIKACLNMGHIPVGMEMFNAGDEEMWEAITRTIDECDYYVVIVAHRYGSTAPDGMSFTQKEYDYAVSRGVPVLGFIIDNGACWPSDRVDKDQAAVEALRCFKSRVKEKKVRFWHDKLELKAEFAMSLPGIIKTNPRPGWAPAPEVSILKPALDLKAELDSLGIADISDDWSTFLRSTDKGNMFRKYLEEYSK